MGGPAGSSASEHMFRVWQACGMVPDEPAPAERRAAVRRSAGGDCEGARYWNQITVCGGNTTSRRALSTMRRLYLTSQQLGWSVIEPLVVVTS